MHVVEKEGKTDSQGSEHLLQQQRLARLKGILVGKGKAEPVFSCDQTARLDVSASVHETVC